MEPHMLDMACKLTYGMGFSIIPMGMDKKPIIKWKQFQEIRPVIHDFLVWPKCNLAIVTGAISGICVIDCESREDAVWFYRNRGKSPVCVKTRRGIHLYFRHPGEHVKNGIKFDNRYDVRGDGGYVLAPPSEHADGVYQWSCPFPFSLDDLPVFDPAWRPETIQDNKQSITDGVAYIATIRAVAGDGGDKWTFRAACCLRDAGLREGEALLALQEWNRTNAEPPWTDQQLLLKIQAAYT